MWLGLCAAPATASIIWSGTIEQQLGVGPVSYTYPLDINDDGVDDFIFNHYSQQLFFDPIDGNAGITHQIADGNYYHDDYVTLSAGILVGSNPEDLSHYWWGGEDMLVGYMWFYYGLDFKGSFVNTTGYLGLSFDIEGETHYGWLRLSHDLDAPNGGYLHLTVHDWAWETEPNTPIVAGAVPEPASVVLALLGAMSVWILRRCQQQKLNDDGEK